MDKNTIGLTASHERDKPQLSSNTVGAVLDYGELLFSDSDIYFGHGTDNAWDEAVSLLLYTLNLGANTDRSILDAELTSQEIRDVFSLFDRRLKERIPAPYLGFVIRSWGC